MAIFKNSNEVDWIDHDDPATGNTGDADPPLGILNQPAYDAQQNTVYLKDQLDAHSETNGDLKVASVIDPLSDTPGEGISNAQVTTDAAIAESKLALSFIGTPRVTGGSFTDSAEMSEDLRSLHDQQGLSVMGREEFQMVANNTRSVHAGSGFLNHGKIEDSVLVDRVHEGVAIPALVTATPDVVYLGSNKDGAVGDSRTGSATVNVNGYQLTLNNGVDGHATSIPIPPASTDSATPNREDLVFLEVWQEKIEDTGFVYPYGNVQYTHPTYEGWALSNQAEDFPGADTYSLHGNWQSAGDFIGYGFSWEGLTEDRKEVLIRNPDNNIYMDKSKLVQVRFRIRVVKGVGSEWAQVRDTDAGGGNYLSYDTSTFVKPRGKLVSITSDLAASNANESGYFCTSSLFSRAVTYPYDTVTGAFVLRHPTSSTALDHNVALDGVAFAMPILMVARRNTGAYHPQFNPEGCAKFKQQGLDGDALFWFELEQGEYSGSSPTVESTEDCFVAGSITGGGMLDDISGRPDGIYFNQITAGDLRDMRFHAQRVADKTELMDSYFNQLVSGTLKGWRAQPEGQPFLIEKGSLTVRNAFAGEVGTSSVEFDGNLYIGILDGNVYKSTDGGKTFAVTGTMAGVTRVGSLAYQGSDLYAGTYPNGEVYKSVDGGANWVLSTTVAGADNITTMYVHNGALFAASYPNGDIVRTSDAGSTWTPNGNLSGVTSVSTFLTHNGDLYAATAPDGNVLKSSDDGVSWSNTGNLAFSQYANGLVEFNGDLYVSSRPEGRIYKSTDHGVNWSSIFSAASGITLYDIVIVSGIMYVTASGGGYEGRVYKSKDGATWDMVLSMPFIQGLYSLYTHAGNLLCFARGFDATDDINFIDLTSVLLSSPSHYEAKYSVTPQCDIIGDPANYPSNWLENGHIGRPLVWSEVETYAHPSDVTTVNASKTWKLSGRIINLDKVVVNSHSEYVPGDTSIVPQTYSWDADTNEVSVSWLGLDDLAVVEIYYSSIAPLTTSADNSDVIALGNVHVTNQDNVVFNELAKQLMVGVSGDQSYNTSTLTTFSYENIGSSKLNANTLSGGPITHNALELDSSKGYGVKCLPYLTEASGQLSLNLVYKGLKYDTDWGDNQTFLVASGEYTELDDNGNRVAFGQRSIPLPYHP